jgi:hypothetical protein
LAVKSLRALVGAFASLNPFGRFSLVGHVYGVVGFTVTARDTSQVAEQPADGNRRRLLRAPRCGGALARSPSLLIAVGFVASLKRPLAVVVDTVAAASARKDQLGALIKAMRALCQTVGQSFRLRQMVEEMPTPVMTPDPKNGFRIGFASRAAVEALRSIAEHLGRLGGSFRRIGAPKGNRGVCWSRGRWRR